MRIIWIDDLPTQALQSDIHLVLVRSFSTARPKCSSAIEGWRGHSKTWELLDGLDWKGLASARLRLPARVRSLTSFSWHTLRCGTWETTTTTLPTSRWLRENWNCSHVLFGMADRTPKWDQTSGKKTTSFSKASTASGWGCARIPHDHCHLAGRDLYRVSPSHCAMDFPKFGMKTVRIWKWNIMKSNEQIQPHNKFKYFISAPFSHIISYTCHDSLWESNDWAFAKMCQALDDWHVDWNSSPCFCFFGL